jgi:rod shape-determining protein MreD
MPAPIRQVLIGLGVVLAQWLVFSHLQVWGVVPDAVLLYVAVIALRYGRVPGALAGFAAGLAMDFLVFGGFIGLGALIKTVLGFVVGVFRSERGEMLRFDPFTAFVGALVLATVHNGLWVITTLLVEDTRTLFAVLGLWLGGALYTAVLALAGSLFRRG